MSAGKRIRGGFAALLSAALIVSGAALAAPAAFADDSAPGEVVDTTQTPTDGAGGSDEEQQGGVGAGADEGEGSGEGQGIGDGTGEGEEVAPGGALFGGDALFSPLSIDEPEVQVSKTTGLNPLGDSITVTGTGFDSTTDAASYYRTPGLKAGVYVQLGWIKDTWAPSAGGKMSGASPDRAGPINQWISNMDPAPIRWTDEATGSFSVTFDNVTKAALTATMPAGARPAVFVMVSGGAPAQAKYEFAYDLEFSAEEGGTGGETGGETGGGETGGTDEGVVVPQTAGVLNWGISSGFAAYTTGSIANGQITSSGVGRSGGVFSYPQSGSSWNAAAQTGSVSFRGSVTFTGHSGAMVETFSNPVISVTGATSGTLTVNGRVFGLNLAAATKSVGANGEVTWRNVPLNGNLSGGSGGAGGAFDMDPITFTVGAVNSATFGSTATRSAAAQQRTPAATPPATSGVDVTTPDDELVAGGDVEITASGFEPNESGILVVIYSEPTVLDTNAKADANGVVRWLGTLPEGLTGEHTITLQGSINAGKLITIADPADKEARALAANSGGVAEQAAGVAAPAEGAPAWIWWTAAIALLVVAGASTGLVVTQRRRSVAPTEL